MAWSKVFSFTGAGAMETRLRRIASIAPQLAGEALHAEATVIFNKSQAVVPVATGALKGSGYVTLPEFIGDIVRVTLGYGGAAAPYAPIVHERIFRMDAEGNLVQIRHKSPTRAKFLEEPMLAAESRLGYNLGRRVGSLLAQRGIL